VKKIALLAISAAVLGVATFATVNPSKGQAPMTVAEDPPNLCPPDCGDTPPPPPPGCPPGC
jgi:hypothetical protein